MLERRIEDWDNAYANGSNIPGGDLWPSLWQEAAGSYRNRLLAEGRAKLSVPYGPAVRHRLDLFMPENSPLGLVVFVHGGYWMSMDQTAWSHLAAGAVDSGYAVAMPAYTLCPDIRISGIVHEIGNAIVKASDLIAGPIMLSGHSAGGHLVTRMISATSPLPEAVQLRIRNVISISGLHDLRPLMNTTMNDVLRLDEAEAFAESPVLLRPMVDARCTCWVGGTERQEFLRQHDILADVWLGLGARTRKIIEPDCHHFNVINGLAQARHPLTQALLAHSSSF